LIFMETSTLLHGFAYGEHIEGGRSLGYRLLAPTEPGPWSAEVETFARRLQATGYPDSWPIAELFCSALMADGWRVIAAVRYGLLDHTPSRRRGGIEVAGLLAPGRIGVPTALALYRWLKHRRALADDLRTLGGYFDLAEALREVPPEPLTSQKSPPPPVLIGAERASVYAATSATMPDGHFALLQNAGEGGTGQWLAFVGEEFPLGEYAERGPVIAWTAQT
jgi:hypothetical protein